LSLAACIHARRKATASRDRIGSLDLITSSPGTVVTTTVLAATIGSAVVMSKTRRVIRIDLAAAALVLALGATCTPPPKIPQPREAPPPDAAPVAVVATPDAAPPELAADQLCERLVERTRAETAAVKDETLAVVAAHCPRWPESVQRCLATAAEQGPCMRDLDPDLRQAFVAEIGRTLTEPPTCEDIAADPSRWLAIPEAATGDSRQRAALAIGDAVAASCASWPESVRECTRDQAGSPRVCLESDLPPTVGPDLDAALARRAELWTRAAAFKPRDRAISCVRVTAAHYGTARWKGKLAELGTAERRRAIKLSVDAFEDACKDEAWSAFMRGCIVAAKTEAERGWCLDTEQRWAYPARGTLPPPP
jgi:hypothetical protein